MSELHEYKAMFHKNNNLSSPIKGRIFTKRKPESITLKKPFLLDDIEYFIPDISMSLDKIKKDYGSGEILEPVIGEIYGSSPIKF